MTGQSLFVLAGAAGAAAFGGAALLGRARRARWVLALGWALHPLWDVALHSTGAGALYTPHGYVAACIGFDLVLAVLIAPWPGAAGSYKSRSDFLQSRRGAAA